jgi:hypothetical protein
VRDLVRDQVSAGLGRRIVCMGTEVDVLSYRVRLGVQRVGAGRGRAPGVYPDRREIRPQGGAELGIKSGGECAARALARRGDLLMRRRRNRAIALGFSQDRQLFGQDAFARTRHSDTWVLELLVNQRGCADLLLESHGH